MKTICASALLALSVSLLHVSTASAQNLPGNNGNHPNAQYDVIDMGQTRELVEALGTPVVTKQMAQLMRRANRITRVTLKRDRFIADAIRNTYVIEGMSCRAVVVANPCQMVGSVEITAFTGTFLPPGQAAQTSYDARVMFVQNGPNGLN